MKLDDVVFDLTLPRALSSELEIRVPEGWEARILGVIGTETISIDTANRGSWKFELGRQQTVQLRLGRKPSAESPRILLRENTVYELTTTDDLIMIWFNTSSAGSKRQAQTVIYRGNRPQYRIGVVSPILYNRIL